MRYNNNTSLSSFATHQSRPQTAQPPSAPAATSSTPRTAGPASQGRPTSAQTPAGSSSFVGPPAGLSEAAFKRLKGDNPPTPEQLEKVCPSWIVLELTYFKLHDCTF